MSAPIEAGAHVVYVRIPTTQLVGRLRLDPLTAPGVLELRGLELRAVPATR